jgi:hypothetical protein
LALDVHGVQRSDKNSNAREIAIRRFPHLPRSTPSELLDDRRPLDFALGGGERHRAIADLLRQRGIGLFDFGGGAQLALGPEARRVS